MIASSSTQVAMVPGRAPRYAGIQGLHYRREPNEAMMSGADVSQEESSMSSTREMALTPQVERRQRERRRHIRRGLDRNRVEERSRMAIVVYVSAMAIAAVGFAIGMWAGWFVWGRP